MAQRQPYILSKLYRPRTGRARQVFALSRPDAEKLQQLSSITVISVTAPERRPANIGEFTQVLRLSFADVDFLDPDLPDRVRSKFAEVFAQGQVRAIRVFVESRPAEVASSANHCERDRARRVEAVIVILRGGSALGSIAHQSTRSANFSNAVKPGHARCAMQLQRAVPVCSFRETARTDLRPSTIGGFRYVTR
ncbi:hypothetical protein [Paraburkholderia dipogonis]|uniref:hypothetical protein n=1 Tax=Paraburkholderia dipogonis TaxID=1211383 RepID=UPI0038BDF701